MSLLRRFRRARNIGIDELQPGVHPNEPAGYRLICEASFSNLPGTQAGGGAAQNQIAGYWWRDSGYSSDPAFPFENHTTLATDASAPVSPSSVLNCNFPVGLLAGDYATFFVGWEDSALGNSATTSPHYANIYTSAWIKIPEPLYENHPVFTKLWYYPNQDRVNSNQHVIALDRDGTGINIQSSFPVGFSLKEVTTDGLDKLVGIRYHGRTESQYRVHTQRWNHLECLFTTNSIVNGIPQSDGILRIWVNGNLALEKLNCRWRSPTFPLGTYQFHAAMVWGGTGGILRTMNNNIQFDHIYVSGSGRMIGSSGTVNPNEPAHYNRILEHSLQAIPSGSNGVAGSWYTWATADASIVADTTEPIASNGSVYRTRFRVGLSEGEAPAAAWGAGMPQQREIYGRFSLFLEPGFKVPQGSKMVKILGFLGYSDLGGSNGEGILGMTSTDLTTSAPFDFQLRQQGQASGSVNKPQNVDQTRYLTTGVWHDIEIQAVLNDIGVANGIWRAWINGIKVTDLNNIVYRNATYPAGFYSWEHVPYWGGNNPANLITVEQFSRIGHVYFSGVPL